MNKNNIGVLQTKVEQGEARLGPGNQVWRVKSEFKYGVTWSVTPGTVVNFLRTSNLTVMFSCHQHP